MNSFKLMEEDRVYGRERSLDDFKNITKFVLSNFLSAEFLPVKNCRAVDGFQNIDRFLKDSPSRLRRVLGAYASRFSDLISRDTT